MNPNDPNTSPPQATMPSILTDAQKAALAPSMPQPTGMPSPIDPFAQPQPMQPTQPAQSTQSQPVGQDQMAKAVNLVLDRAFRRMVQVLTDEDIKTIQELDKSDTTGETVRYFLLTKVPNMDAIINEEIAILNKEAASASTPQTT